MRLSSPCDIPDRSMKFVNVSQDILRIIDDLVNSLVFEHGDAFGRCSPLSEDTVTLLLAAQRSLNVGNDS